MNAVVEHEQVRLPALSAGGSVRAIVPQDFEGAWRIAVAVTKAGMAPRGLESAEKAMVAIMHGLEVGFTPMAALQSIAVVNGRPTIWGDGALALVQASGKLEAHKEWFEGEGDARKAMCRVVRKGDPEPKVGEFSVANAKTAGLWGKKGRSGEPTPWITYPDRMLKMRARGFALRDGFSDVLKGLGITEEVQDIVLTRDEAPDRPQPPRPSAPPAAQITQSAVVADAETGEIIEASEDSVAASIDADPPAEQAEFDATAYFDNLETSLAAETTVEGVEERWVEYDPMATFDGDDVNLGIAKVIKARRLKQIGAAS